MSELQNNFIKAINENDINGAGKNITEQEWSDINRVDKSNLLSTIVDSKIKKQFEKKYNNLEEHFKPEGIQETQETTGKELLMLKRVFKLELVSNYFQTEKVNIEKKDIYFPVLKDFGELKLVNLLEGFKNYIEDNLVNLTFDQKEKIKISIIKRFKSLNIENFLNNKKEELLEEILDKKEEKIDLEKDIKKLEFQKKSVKTGLTIINNKIRIKKLELRNFHIPELKDYRWIISEEISDKLNFVTDKLLPNLAYYSENKDYVDSIKRIDHNYSSNKRKKAYAIKELLNSDIQNDGTFDKSFSLFDDDFNLYDSTKKTNLKKVNGINILSERDRKIEGEVMTIYLTYVIMMMTPYAGNLASLPADIRDAFTNKEGTLQALKEHGLVPQEYKMNKEWYDYAFGVLGLASTIMEYIPVIAAAGVGLHLAIKSGKLAKITAKMTKLGFSRKQIDKMFSTSIYDITNIKISAPKIHSINKISIENLIKVNSDGVIKIESSDFFNNIPTKDLEIVLLEKIVESEKKMGIKVKNIDISEFNNTEYKYLKEKIFNIIGNNFPLLEVLRLREGDKVTDITFTGVKILNDNISKEFVDLFSGKLKEMLHSNFKKFNKLNKEQGRVIRDNYKHMTFSMKKEEEISKAIFGNNISKKELVKEVFSNLNKHNLEKSLKEAKIKDLNKIEELLLKHFDLGVGTTIVEKSNKGLKINPNDKLNAFYKAEIASRNKVDLNNLGKNLEFNFEYIKDFSKNVLILEQKIVEKFEGKSFRFNDTNFDIVVNGKINNILLRYVRKGEDIGNKELNILVKRYIDNLNDGFDFIAPFINKEQIKEINIIEKQIQDGKIDINLLKNTYKNTLSVEALKAESKGQKGLRVFIDIVDMGIMNLTDFRHLAGKIVSGEIKSENIDELLDAGSTATTKFQNLVSSLKYDYPKAKISLGGDEIFIFLPGKTKSETIKIVESITGNLEDKDLIGRISSSVNENNNNIYDILDSSTGINKVFERTIEKVIHNNKDTLLKNTAINNKLINLRLSTININIDEKIQKLISENGNDFITDLKRIIDENNIKNILSGKIDKYLFSFDLHKRSIKGKKEGILKKINLVITKGRNSLIISVK